MNKPAAVFSNLLITIACLIACVEAAAEGISIERATGRIRDTEYLMDASIRYDLGDSVLEALSHGIQLQFDVTVEIKRERNWIWDETIKFETIIYRLAYQPLSNNYLVTNLNTGDGEQLHDLASALKYLGTITNYPLIGRDELNPEASYTGYITSELRIRTLPLPLQPLAYISPNWHLTSLRYEWTIR
jgi:hypothetical protein